MKLHPFDKCAAAAFEVMDKKGATIFQQFNCAKCGTKQTMSEKDKFFTRGICEECGAETDIEQDGCNYMVVFGRT
jgi:hypothetical protein